VQSWFLDLNLVMAYWNSEGGARSYHHTAPVNALYALHEALVLLKQEGLENAWKRHMDNHLMLRAGLETMGIDFIVPEEERLPQLNAIAIPEGIEDVAVRTHLLNEYNLEIGAGLGPLAGKIWRIGQMGYASNPENILFCIDALGNVLNEFDYNTPVNKALEAARAVQAAL
jgi:alanine-glyoxylate transaminase/serine-glyoxylate transaminase/serine-pyruvate transaminase